VAGRQAELDCFVASLLAKTAAHELTTTKYAIKFKVLQWPNRTAAAESIPALCGTAFLKFNS
jgi:hypothetical protein